MVSSICGSKNQVAEQTPWMVSLKTYKKLLKKKGM